MKPILITFEGGEGVGKSTQIRRLSTHLKTINKDIVLTREPGGCPSAEEIRKTMLNSPYPLDPLSQVFLIMAARREHYLQTLKPALDKGLLVLCDRFIDSTLVYQGLKGVSFECILSLHNLATNNLMPTLTFILDADPSISLERMKKRGIENMMDSLDKERHKSLREGYLRLSKIFPERIFVIDSSGTEDETFERINSILERLSLI